MQNLGEEVPFWEYFKELDDGYVRLNHDLMIAEYFDPRVGFWVRHDDLAPPIVWKGNATEAAKMSTSLGRPERERLDSNRRLGPLASDS